MGSGGFNPWTPPGGGIGVGYSVPFNPPFCFSEDTEMIILENNKEHKRNASKIKEGDLVLTFNGQDKIFSKVTESIKNKGIFKFYEIKLKNEKSNSKHISVTGNHTMIIFGKDQNDIKFKFAYELKVGDLLRTSDGLFEINEINHVMKNDSYKIASEKGTVLANDVLVSTVYLRGNKQVKESSKLIDSAKIPIEIKN